MTNQDCATHYDRGKQYELQGKLDNAITEYKEAIKNDPDYIPAHYDLGMIYRMQGHFNLADKEFQEVTRINPNFIANDSLNIIGQKAKAEQANTTTSSNKKHMPLVVKLIISVLAGFLVGGPIAATSDNRNPTIGITIAIIVFVVLSIIFSNPGGSRE